MGQIGMHYDMIRIDLYFLFYTGSNVGLENDHEKWPQSRFEITLDNLDHTAVTSLLKGHFSHRQWILPASTFIYTMLRYWCELSINEFDIENRATN